ncbi:MAG: Bug family tripartite tricarboxylate transporter substrate binding protein [Hyphomicrobiaceae bacterium]
MKKYLGTLGFLIGALALIGTAEAQFPNRTVRIIVPYPAGGEGDSSARAVASRLSDKWKQSVVVENRPGASTIIGTQTVATAPADGYTLLLTSFGFTTVQFRKQPLPYDVKALAPIYQVATSPLTLYVTQDLPVKSVDELVAYAKAKPKTLMFASSGIASSPHIGAELFAGQNGIEITHVPYKGTSPAVADLLPGHVHAIWGAPSLMSYVTAGKLRVLAVANAKRLTNHPEVPTTGELGHPNFIAASWYGMFLPAATPADIQDKIYADIKEIGATQGLKDALLKIGLEPSKMTREEFAAFLVAERSKWGDVIKTRNINIE